MSDIWPGPYTRLLVRDEESGQWVVEVIEFPNCMSFGATPDEAMVNIDDAMAGWIESEIAMGHDIPEPLGNREYSGKLVLRLPSSLHRKVALLAEFDGVSLNQWLVAAIAEKAGAASERVVRRAPRKPVGRKRDGHETARR